MTQSEYKLTTDYIREQLEAVDWKFVLSSELTREGIDEPLLEQNLRRALKKINEDLDITKEEINEVVQKIKLENSSTEGNKNILHYLKYGVSIKFEKTRVVENVQLIDYKNPENNEFIISREVSFRGKERIRTDIILYVNGIPLVNIEGKNPVALSSGWRDAYRQIKQYEKDVPELYKYAQIGVAADVEARYFPIVSWQSEIKTYAWKEDDKEGLDALVLFLQPSRVIDFVRNYTFIREENSEVTKVMARYMQHRASEKICSRAVGNMEGNEEKNKGLIWHWQGSGKTLTMIFAAHKLHWEKSLENPTIFFIIDRIDLEEQLSQEVAALDLNFTTEKINTIKDLQEVVSADNYRGKRGSFITLIHKFDESKEWFPEDITQKIREGGEKETIAQRKNVVVFLDEVHRTQYGTLAAQRKEILESAFFFGFTGTPISKKEKDTYKEFGYPVEEESYLDRYFIDESQEDGFTVPIVFETRDDKIEMPVEIRDYLEKLPDEIGEGDALDAYEKDEIKEEVAKKVNTIKVFLENKNFINKKAKDIAEDFKSRIDGRFKAMVVAGSRKACVLYKQAFDELLGEEETEVVMTFNIGDKEELIRNYYSSWREKYSGKDDKSIRDEIIRKFKEEDAPKILIVTDMLLTGFDAPILQTMYFDKPLKEHKLLQAVARVNRVYGDVKEAGVIVDYVGVARKAKKTINDYYREKNISSAILDYEGLVERLSNLLDEMQSIVGSTPQDITRKELNNTIESLRDNKAESSFIEAYKEARKIFEILGSYQRKLDFLDEYKWVSAVYAYYIKLKGERGEEMREKVEKYFKDTVELLHETLSIEEIKKDLPPFKLDREYFKSLRESELGKQEKVNNIVFGLERLVIAGKNQDPILLSVYEKVEKLVRKWREKTISFEELHDYATKIVDEIESKQGEKESLELSELEYGIYMELSNILEEKSEDELSNLAQKLYQNIENDLTKDWLDHPVRRKRVSEEVRTFSRKIKIKEKFNLEEMKKLYKQLIRVVENYGE